MGVAQVKDFLPVGAGVQNYELFHTKATAVNAELTRVASPTEALETALKIIKELGAKSAVSTELTIVDGQKLKELLQGAGVQIELGHPPRATIEKAHLGISEFDLGVAETGSLAQDATDVYMRLISSLPPNHLAFVKTSHLVGSYAEALETLYKANGNSMPGCIAYVSGPSRTADIERVLAIGVHGPKRIFVICVD